jgi:YD repeat-containing protein
MDDGRQEYSVTYQYDLLKRLVSATAGSNWTQTFGYDGFGNLTSKTSDQYGLHRQCGCRS